jgi:hypothetical protein
VRRVRLPCPRSSKRWGIASRDVRRAAAGALVKIGTPAVPALIQALGDSGWDVRVRQRRRWANSATPKPCPRSSKRWGIAIGRFAVRQRRRWANSATPKPCPRSSKRWGIAIGRFAVRQRRRWANSATPKPCPRSSKHWGIATVLFAVRQRRRWANSATHKPSPRSSKHWGIAPCGTVLFAVGIAVRFSGGVGQTRRPPSRAPAHPSTGG